MNPIPSLSQTSRPGALDYDVAVIGAGPAGSTCAALCAQTGRRVALIDRASFPRDKACGDTLNPACWPIFDQLGVTARIASLQHARLAEVEFGAIDGTTIRIPLPESARGEIAVQRRSLDAALLARAAELGTEIHTGTTISAIDGNTLTSSAGAISARVIVAADGRNSTIARLLGVAPPAHRDRVGIQSHIALPAALRETVALHLRPEGYCGLADSGAAMLTICLVARPGDLESVRSWARRQFGIDPDQEWRTITPLSRAPISPLRGSVMFTGDAARVVEPFTGEGIYYALASGALAAGHIIAGTLASYPAAHAKLYRGRLWINHLARAAVLHPRMGSGLIAAARRFPAVLGILTRKVVGAAPMQAAIRAAA